MTAKLPRTTGGTNQALLRRDVVGSLAQVWVVARCFIALTGGVLQAVVDSSALTAETCRLRRE